MSARGIFPLCALLAVCTNFFEAFSSSYPASSNAAFLTFFNNSYIDRGQSAGIGHLVLKCFWTFSLYAAPAGNLLGCAAAPFCISAYGPKTSLLLSNTYALVASLISCAAIVFEFPELLLLARLLASGNASLALLALILFLQQVPAPAERGRFSFLCPFSLTLIECCALVLNACCPGFGQRLLCLVALPILPQLVGIVLALRLPETPNFIFFSRANHQKAAAALRFYRGVDLTDEQVQAELAKMSAEQADCLDHRRILLGNPGRWIGKLFAQRHRRMATLMGLCALQITVGGWPVLETSALMMVEQFGKAFSQIASFVLLLGYFLCSLAGLVFIEKFARRPLVLRSALLNIVCLCLVVCFDRLGHLLASSRWLGFLGLPFLLLFAGSLSAALGPISYFLTAELLPMPCPLSSIVLALVLGLNICSSFLFSWITPPLFHLISSWAFLPLFVLPSLLCLVPLYYFMPETRARETAEIVAELEE